MSLPCKAIHGATSEIRLVCRGMTCRRDVGKEPGDQYRASLLSDFSHRPHESVLRTVTVPRFASTVPFDVARSFETSFSRPRLEKTICLAVVAPLVIVQMVGRQEAFTCKIPKVALVETFSANATADSVIERPRLQIEL